MAVYVDKAQHRLGRMIMCHMLADTTEELLAMADHVGLSRTRIQKAGSPHEHFDICKAKRAIAVAAGAIEITYREVGLMLRKRRIEFNEKDNTNG